MKYLKIELLEQDIDGWAVGVTRYFPYDDAKTCADETTELARFNALSPAQKLAQTIADAPAGFHFEVIDCGNYDGFGIVSISDADWFGTETTPPATGDGFDSSYAYSNTGADFAGRPFVSTPAPILTPRVDETKPRLTGNNYSFSRQNALNVLLAERFPANTGFPWFVNYAGPGFTQAADRDAIVSRGFSAVRSSTPQSYRFGRDKLLVNIDGGYGLATALASTLPSNDARKQWLEEWNRPGVGNGPEAHYLIDNEAAARAFGAFYYSQYQGSDWTNGQPLAYYMPNFEYHVANPRGSGDSEAQWRRMHGWFCEGFKQAAIDAGQTPATLVLYDLGFMAHFDMVRRSFDQDASGQTGELGFPLTYDPEPGIPFMFSYITLGGTWAGGSKAAPLGANNPTAQYVKANGSYAGSVEYMRNTWGSDSLWQKNPDGSKKTRVVNNVTLLVGRTDAHRTTIGGETVDILGEGYYSPGESYNFLLQAYIRLQTAVVETYFRAGGKHLSLSTDRQAGWENLKLSQAARHDAEFKSGNEITKPDNSGPSINPATNAPYNTDALNSRPLNPDWQEGDIMWHLLAGRDAYTFWMGPQIEIPTQGADAVGQDISLVGHEATIKALHRMKQFAWLKTQTTRYVVPQYLVHNIDSYRGYYDPRNEFEKKPAFIARICDARTDKANKTYVVFGGSYLAQDEGDFSDWTYWWVDSNGTAITPGYRARLAGRQFFADDHEVPAVVAGLPASRMRVQGIDLTGETQTLTGDYRSSRITNHPTPPALA